VSILDGTLTTVAFCWRLERVDGVTLGYTSHDRDLIVGGLLYRAAPGMLPSAIALSDGFDGASLDVRGALSADAITASDLAAGRWDGASVSVLVADWEDNSAAAFEIARGELGDVSILSNGFEAELRGLASALDRPVVEQTSPECRAELGDSRCRVDLAALTHVVRIVAVAGEMEIEVSALPPGAELRNGRMRWLGGPNSGLIIGLAGAAGTTLTLREAPHFAAAEDDLVELTEGCDKSIATCSGRFANALNFRGEPNLPGMDLLTRYPGA
jgi:uncharacterized phage protein (TIGR02218 family)